METATIKRKIDVLSRAADAIENGEVRYNWKRTYSCNCGIVAQIALGEDWKGLKLRLSGYDPMHASWRWLVKTRDKIECETTRLPIRTVFEAMDECGFTDREICNLECLNDPIICRQANISLDPFVNATVFAGDPIRCVKYMRAWVAKLQKDLKVKPKARKSQK